MEACLWQAIVGNQLSVIIFNGQQNTPEDGVLSTDKWCLSLHSHKFSVLNLFAKIYNEYMIATIDC